jgi:Na+/glutamate symporter
VKEGSGGVGFTGLLLLLFIALKLCGVIDWMWLWVLAPLWIPLTVFLVILTIALVAFLIGFAVVSVEEKWTKR